MSTALVVDAAATPEDQEAGPARNRLGVALLVLSAAGLPLGRLAARRLGGWGDLLVESGCALLFARDVTMIFGGAPSRLRPLPRALLLLELVASGTAVLAGLGRWVGKPDTSATAGRATAAVSATFALHTARQAIYLSRGHGLRPVSAAG